MLMTAPEVTALAHTMQPTLPLFNIIEGYQDIQSVVAVLESQASFSIDHNLGRYKGDTPLEIPDEEERIRYLGFFLLNTVNLKNPLKMQLQFGSRYAWTPLIMMLRAFGLQGQRKIRITQGLTLHQDAVVNASGGALFEFEPLDEWIKYPDRITGFVVYLIRPPGQRQAPPAEVVVAPEPELQEEGIIRSSPGLNVYKSIDMRA
ncbi:MAG TPA: hypothetical protein V6D23_15440 [Candidatus Obscuribacterales bacterium]